MIPPEVAAQIKRLHFGEHWKIGAIAESLSVHPDTVRRACETERFNAGKAARPSVVDAFIPFLRETLVRYPKVVGTRLYEMIKARGYAGKVYPVWRVVRELRPQRTKQAYLRLSAMPAEFAQVDWGHFGSVRIGRGTRPLSCFVMVLAYSRAVFARFTLDQTLESFVRCHVEAFAALGGVARVHLYDNLKSAVLERRGEAIHFHPRLLDLAGWYRFEPRPCNVRASWEKGRVERRIGHIRASFFAARTFRDVDDLNAQFTVWRDEVAHARLVPGDPRITVAEALEAERKYLQPLPEKPFETDLLRTVVSDKTAHVRFDRNSYSIPAELVGKPLTLVASEKVVRVLEGASEVARHVRSYDTACVIADPEHVAKLVEEKQAAARMKGRDRLTAEVPEARRFFQMLALRGDNLGRNTLKLLRLLEEYGARELGVALSEAVDRGAIGFASVAQLLERRRRDSGAPPPVPVELPEHLKAKDVHTTPHRLEDYDALGHNDDDKQS